MYFTTYGKVPMCSQIISAFDWKKYQYYKIEILLQYAEDENKNPSSLYQ